MHNTSNKAIPAKAAAATKATDVKKRKWQLQTYLDRRDFQGAMTLLRFQAKHGEGSRLNTLWTAYCLFHMGEYVQALEHYEQVLKLDTEDDSTDASRSNPILANMACCYLYLSYYDFAKSALAKIVAPADTATAELHQRLRLVLAQRTNDSEVVDSLLYDLRTSSIPSQLAAAAVLFHQRNFHGAADIYKRVLARHETHAAINVYLAMCYYHLEYFDISSELLATYLATSDGHSNVAKNLLACNTFHLVDGVAAEKSLQLHLPQPTRGHALVEHNVVVFRQGDVGLRLWPPLLGTVPEAKLNLALFHIKHDTFEKAFDLLDTFEPAQPIAYILKAIVHMWMGQQQVETNQAHHNITTPTNEHLFLSEKFFETVGAAPSECDTIRGRQAMASMYMLRNEFDTALVYLKSIAMYHVHDDAFNWNYGVALAATGMYSEGESVLCQVQHPSWRQHFIYVAWLSRCHIRSISQSHLAWDVYLNVRNAANALKLLKLIANEYYLMADYYFAAKAFDVLERVDPDPEFWEAKRGACVGYFHKAVSGKCDTTKLVEVLNMLEASKHNQGKVMARTLRTYCESVHLI
ncbi:hypothetical protein H257_15116 [Aphanomyces astaci]|uniref:Intraflagellar transport protein 56 n=1 Tax=Aphanomyces astaci TaxID=112090 RepID=W4FQE1_APHAT|nr:hypothetical protein H257_15116 [Aphanomyces astaci]ETV69161.1 hypothetical protein H257_15116 [Aphanomyces astaci]|eukprot:XP_009841414.1 hypothetical protein H257_15116 [Aphanomyces astaci]